MAPKTNKQWGRSTKVHPKRQSFKEYIEGAAEWAEQNLTTQCNSCGERTSHTKSEIKENNITITFTCDAGHTTTATTKESELRRTHIMRE